MMETIAATDAGMSGASSVHMNIFGLHPVVVHGTPEQKQRWLPRHCHLTGQKVWISTAQVANKILILAQLVGIHAAE